MTTANVQYISDERGDVTGVIVPIDLWREIASEEETRYLLGSEVMRSRLLKAMRRTQGIPFDEGLKKLGLP